jgi:hypothetical protein
MDCLERKISDAVQQGHSLHAISLNSWGVTKPMPANVQQLTVAIFIYLARSVNKNLYQVDD